MSNRSTTRHYRPSSRSLYPTFLSIPETLAIQTKSALKGIQDAFRWNIVILTIASDSEIRSNVSKSALLNSISLFSIYAFDFLFWPLVRNQERWFRQKIGWLYQIVWLFPVVGIALYLNNAWCTVIAQRAYILQHGTRPIAPKSVTYTGMLKTLATSAYRIVMVFTSVSISFALRDVPYVGPVVNFALLCWLYAYYCFEYVWIAQGLSLSRRVRYVEERWAYFFAFGLPTAMTCMLSNSLASLALFGLLFPTYIIMAMHARPVPRDPYNPSPPASKSSESNIIRHPSPFIPIRLPIFAVIIWLNDGIVRILSLEGRRPGAHSKMSRPTAGDMAESIEEGESMEFDHDRGSWRGRRKMD